MAKRLIRLTRRRHASTQFYGSHLMKVETASGLPRTVVGDCQHLGIERLHVHAYFECMGPPSQNQTAQRTYVAVVPAPGERHVPV